MVPGCIGQSATEPKQFHGSGLVDDADDQCGPARSPVDERYLGLLSRVPNRPLLSGWAEARVISFGASGVPRQKLVQRESPSLTQRRGSWPVSEAVGRVDSVSGSPAFSTCMPVRACRPFGSTNGAMIWSTNVRYMLASTGLASLTVVEAMTTRSRSGDGLNGEPGCDAQRVEQRLPGVLQHRSTGRLHKDGRQHVRAGTGVGELRARCRRGRAHKGGDHIRPPPCPWGRRSRPSGTRGHRQDLAQGDRRSLVRHDRGVLRQELSQVVSSKAIRP